MILARTTKWIAGAALMGAMLLAGCGDQPDLPTSINTQPEDFGANDTSFVRVTPDWDFNYGHDWIQPTDLLVGYDGRLFVVDSASVGTHTNGRVTQLTRSGSVMHNDLFAGVADTSFAPQGIGQDSRMNLYMVNGTNSVYVWNQYINDIGVAAILSSFTLRNAETGDSLVIDNTQPLYQQVPDGWNSLGDPAWQLDEQTLVSIIDADSTAKYEEEYRFFTDTSSANIHASFTDVDGGPSRSGTVYVTDRGSSSGGDRIFTLTVLPSRVLILNDGSVNYVYHGDYVQQVVGAGTGQASTNDPTSVVTSGAGSATAVYFAQTSGSFRVQRVKRDVSGNWLSDIGGGSGGEPTVMQLGYFNRPAAIAVGESDSRGLGLFYVADSDKNKVTAFHPNGWEFRQVSVDEELIDLVGGEVLDDVLADRGETLDVDLNPSLVDFVAARTQGIALDSSEVLSDVLAGMELEFDGTLNDPVLENYIAQSDTLIHLLFAADTTVSVYYPILNAPRGVATLEGVVYIADTGNDRILRFRRTDSDSYIPSDPDS
ncbi:hypothetical protein KQI63_07235 [bacterium]|nr:hypothetical protein [bacterium]